MSVFPANEEPRRAVRAGKSLWLWPPGSARLHLAGCSRRPLLRLLRPRAPAARPGRTEAGEWSCFSLRLLGGRWGCGRGPEWTFLGAGEEVGSGQGLVLPLPGSAPSTGPDPPQPVGSDHRQPLQAFPPAPLPFTCGPQALTHGGTVRAKGTALGSRSLLLEPSLHPCLLG